MKPNALIGLSFDGIAVHARMGDEWKTAGKVALDGDDLKAALAPLIEDVEAATGAPIRSKLNIPNDQIKFIAVPAIAGDKSDQRSAVLAALDGQTPYATSDLAVDWTTSNSTTYIAAVATETLLEAESFAQDHGLNPVSFVATPEADTFVGPSGPQELFFGTASNAAALLEGGESVTRDTAPAVLSGPLELASTSAAAATPDASADQDTPPDEATEQTAEALPQTEPDPAPEPVAFSTKRTVALDENLQPSLTAPAQGAAPALAGATRTGADAASDTPPKAPPVAATPNGTPTDAQAAPPVTGTPQSATTATTPPLAAPTTAANTAPEDLAEALDTASSAPRTVFDDQAAATPPRKPRFLGLILTGVLLLFLLIVALLAGGADTASLQRWWQGDTQTQIAETPAALDRSAPGFASPSSEELADAASEPVDLDGITPPSEATLIAAPQLSPTPTRRDQPEAVPSMSMADARSAYAETGIWQRAPAPQIIPSQSELNSLYVASLDPTVGISDAVALPSARRLLGDDVPGRLSNPAAADQAFSFGPDGLVIPSVEGTLSPDGITIFAGKPPLVPPVRSTDQAALPADADTDAAPTADPALAGLRPQARPENLSDGNERETLGGYTRSELAALRPALRPRGLVPPPAPDPEPRTAAVAPTPNNPSLVPTDPKPAGVPETTAPVAEALAEALAQAVVVPPRPKGTAQAVARSVTPKPRPRNFDRKVARQKEQAAPAARNDRGNAVASVAPRTVRPSGTTNATVARNATLRNEINLRRVNLIGVYGKTNSRRALVRLSNGRYVRVKVGDRVDGGRVAAIGQSELRYTKGGRTVRLKIPSS